MTKTFTFVALILGAFVGGVILTSNSATQAFQGVGFGGDKEQIMEAIDANDYNLLPADAKERIDAETFAEKVEHKAEHELARAQLEEIVKNNDFAGFQNHVAERKADMEAKRLERAEEKGKELKKGRDRPEPTTEELQEKFDKMVAYYQENGELQQRGRGFGKRGSHGFGKGGGCSK